MMSFFRQHYNKTGKQVLFMIGSDSLNWAEQNFANMSNVVVLDQKSSSTEDDFAFLASCCPGGFIMSTGTYSWWLAFLSQAEQVVYYDIWPLSSGFLVNVTKNADFFPPSWLPMH